VIIKPDLLDRSISLTREAALDLCSFLELSPEEQAFPGNQMLVRQALDRCQRAVKVYNEAFKQ
jgi:hypothetical protein